jgi:hypothetical protein
MSQSLPGEKLVKLSPGGNTRHLLGEAMGFSDFLRPYSANALASSMVFHEVEFLIHSVPCRVGVGDCQVRGPVGKPICERE